MGLGLAIHVDIGFAVVDEALGERAELQFVEHLAQGVQVGRFALERISLEGDGHVGDDGGEPLREANLLGVLLDALLLRTLEFAGVVEQVLD